MRIGGSIGCSLPLLWLRAFAISLGKVHIGQELLRGFAAQLVVGITGCGKPALEDQAGTEVVARLVAMKIHPGGSSADHKPTEQVGACGVVADFSGTGAGQDQCVFAVVTEMVRINHGGGIEVVGMNSIAGVAGAAVVGEGDRGAVPRFDAVAEVVAGF